MSVPSSNLDDPRDIRMVFQRLCREGGFVRIKHEAFVQDFPIHAELEDQLVLGISDVVRGQWGLKPGKHVLGTLEDRGRRFEAILEMTGHGRFEGLESCAFDHPRMLKCLDENRLADFLPEPPRPCTYSTRTLEIRDGKVRAFGLEGLELVFAGNDVREGLLRPGDTTVLELNPGKEDKLVLPCRVAHLGDGYAGIRLREDGDRALLLAYRAWLEEMLRGQRRRDEASFEAKGARAGAKGAEADAPRAGTAARWLVDRDPLLLVVSEGEAFPRRMAESLGKKYGVAWLDYVQGRVQPSLAALGVEGTGWGRVKLVMVHQRLRVSSGLELTKQLSISEACPLPILVVGQEEDVSLKRNRAIAAGAVDFISVDPFHVLRVIKAVEDTLKMFG